MSSDTLVDEDEDYPYIGEDDKGSCDRDVGMLVIGVLFITIITWYLMEILYVGVMERDGFMVTAPKDIPLPLRDEL